MKFKPFMIIIMSERALWCYIKIIINNKLSAQLIELKAAT